MGSQLRIAIFIWLDLCTLTNVTDFKGARTFLKVNVRVQITADSTGWTSSEKRELKKEYLFYTF